MVGNRFLGNASIIIAEYMALRDSNLATKDNGFLNLEIEGDSRVVIDCYNKKSSLPNSIIRIMVDVWRSSQDVNMLFVIFIGSK